jgi:hypothetical protein
MLEEDVETAEFEVIIHVRLRCTVKDGSGRRYGCPNF